MVLLSNKSFELVENDAGHAAESTVMTFGPQESPCVATYTGPNVAHGQVIVAENQMLYHAADAGGVLSAGKASITLEETPQGILMTLQWQWLTGDGASGVSKWREVT